jgi:threonine 3-dehydrogenase
MRSGLPLARIITHHFHLDNAQDAFDVFMSGNAGKVILEY